MSENTPTLRKALEGARKLHSERDRREIDRTIRQNLIITEKSSFSTIEALIRTFIEKEVDGHASNLLHTIACELTNHGTKRLTEFHCLTIIKALLKKHKYISVTKVVDLMDLHEVVLSDYALKKWGLQALSEGYDEKLGSLLLLRVHPRFFTREDVDDMIFAAQKAARTENHGTHRLVGVLLRIWKPSKTKNLLLWQKNALLSIVIEAYRGETYMHFNSEYLMQAFQHQFSQEDYDYLLKRYSEYMHEHIEQTETEALKHLKTVSDFETKKSD
jgi:hypothetical protein